MKIKVANSGIVKLPTFGNDSEGVLTIAEEKRTIPFKIKRIYFINKLASSKMRGGHAHKKLVQVIFCINGAFDLRLDDGSTKQTIRLKEFGEGVILGNKLWHSMTNFTPDCVIAVISNDYYKESDYLRKYEDFMQFISNKS